uniref:Perforin 1 n=2 Tax=Latimeria chalumnae TaxID=7897 RepID=H2ZWI2_LATCH
IQAVSLLLSLNLVLVLLSSVKAQCTTATYEECQRTNFVPGHNLGGEGFDITTLTRKGAYVYKMESSITRNRTCTVCKNALMANEAQKLPLSVVDWRVIPRCSTRVHSAVYETSLAFIKSTNSVVVNDWRVGLGVMPMSGVNVEVAVSGSHSKIAEYVMKKAKNDKYSFSSQEVSCNYYSYRIKGNAKIKPQFLEDLKFLPKTYNSHTKVHYQRIVDIYGTHYIRQVQLGGWVREVTALRTCELALDGLTDDEVKDCLGVEASINILQVVNASSKLNACKEAKSKKLSNSNFSHKYNEREVEVIGGGSTDVAELLFLGEGGQSIFKTWVDSLKATPDIISYALAPLHELVRKAGSTKENLKQAITEYIKERAIMQQCPKCPGGSFPSQGQKCTCTCQESQEVTSGCCPKERGLGTLSMIVKKAEHLYGDVFSKTDAYVKVIFERAEQRTPVIWNNNDPVWNQKMEFGTVKVLVGSQMKVEVWDQDKGFDDDKLGACQTPVKATSGFEEHICYLKHGSITFALKLACVSTLMGSHCENHRAH